MSFLRTLSVPLVPAIEGTSRVLRSTFFVERGLPKLSIPHMVDSPRLDPMFPSFLPLSLGVHTCSCSTKTKKFHRSPSATSSYKEEGTVLGGDARMSHRNWNTRMQWPNWLHWVVQPVLPIIPFHFLCDILHPDPVQTA